MSPTNRKDAGNRILVAYFSHSGNTRMLANRIHESAGGDMFEILPEKGYPSDYDAAVKQAKEELESDLRPALKAKVKDIGQYDTVFVGYPIWWGTMPMPVFTFLSRYDLSGKTVVPFCTNGGSGLGRSLEDIRKLCSRSNILEGLAVSDGELEDDSAVAGWLRRLGMTK
jgi:flavodoxin